MASEVTMAVLWPCSGWSSPSSPVLILVSACRARGVNKERRAPWASPGHAALAGRRYEAGQALYWESSPSPALTDAFAFPRERLECQESLVSR